MNGHCRIENVNLTNTIFFKSLRLNFSENLNCIMGARGTGKTTLLEFIRYALGIPLPVVPDKAKEIQALLESNLKNGVIEVGVRKDGTLYRIERTWGTAPQVRNDLGSTVNVDPVSFFTIDIFGQGEIEALAIRPDEQLSKLIDGFSEDRLGSIKKEIEYLKKSLDDNATKQLRLMTEIKNIEDSIALLGDAEDQFTKLQKELSAVESEELEEIQMERIKHRDCEVEAEVLGTCQNWIAERQIELANLQETLNRWKQAFEFPQDYQRTNWVTVSTLDESIPNKIENGREIIGKLHALLFEMSKDVLEVSEKLNPLHTQQTQKFEMLLAKYKTYQSQMQRLVELQKKLDELKKLRQDLSKKEENLKSLSSERRDIREKFPELTEERFKKRYEIASELTGQLGSEIKVDIERNALRNEYYSTLLEILHGSTLKYTSLVDRIVNYYAPDEFSAVIRRRDRLSLSLCFGFDDSRIDTLINHLLSNGGENLFRIESLTLDDEPVISLKIRERGAYTDQFRPAHRLSTGQKCTTILPILLIKGSGPLIIDQPEDNLDNRYIYSSLVKLIRSIAPKRQLIFITHNPNIPVLGDAAYNLFLASEENEGRILSSGSLYDVKNEIVEYLEGGEEAFKLRETFYEQRA